MEKVTNVVICLSPFISHFIPTIEIANEFRKIGVNVIYLGPKCIKETVRSQSFIFEEIVDYDENTLNSMQKGQEFGALLKIYQKIYFQVNKKIRKLNPDIVLVPLSRFPIYLLPLIDRNKKVILYSLCAGQPKMNLKSPPVTSNCRLYRNRLDKVVNGWYWMKRFVQKGIIPILKKKYCLFPFPQIYEWSKKKNIKLNFGIDGFYPDLPVAILGSELLETHNNRKGNCFYAGLCVSEKRNGPRLEKEQIYFIKKKKGKLFYCCMGTMSERYINVKAFIYALIEVFENNPQWNLFLCLGKYKSDIKVETYATNVTIAEFVDQQYILKYADFAITHGGHGSIKECIYYSVPMIVFPCCYDQRGNAVRVKEKEIGIISNMLQKTIIQRIIKKGCRRINGRKLEKLLNDINNPIYKKNIISLKEIILKSDECKNMIKTIILKEER